MRELKIEAEEHYEKCRALISVLGYSDCPDVDRAALQWILEEMFEKLGEAIGITQTK